MSSLNKDPFDGDSGYTLDHFEDQEKIDLFSLKILILLICKDSVEVKANIFADIIAENENWICIENRRLFRSIKLMIFFSYFLPKVF